MTSEPKWQKSSFSGGGGEQCLELADVSGEILVRESDDPNIILTTTPTKLHTLIHDIKAGKYDHFAN
ncbi:DUF397 domain-containing protein [Streptomyces buecherae]|uniref:DUF397 domain-containing protein n=1 Tax=Streptomyces buecherae TaxID=2763006 RepID=UPI003657155D